MGFLDPKVWLAIGIAWLVGMTTGFAYRYVHSVSLSKYQSTANELSKLKADVITANNAARIERERSELAAKSAAAAASVALSVARVQAENADTESRRLLAANYNLLHGIGVPGGVRDAYNAGIRLTPKAATDPPGVQPTGTTSAPLTLDVYAGVCTENAVNQNALADRYDALYTYTKSLWAACNRKEQ
jgi:uncharacterized membrane-anchored protein YhcB (DUF1043 family)